MTRTSTVSRFMCIYASHVLLICTVFIISSCATYLETYREVKIESSIRAFEKELAKDGYLNGSILGARALAPGTIVSFDSDNNRSRVLCNWDDVLLEPPTEFSAAQTRYANKIEEYVNMVTAGIEGDLNRNEGFRPISSEYKITNIGVLTVSLAEISASNTDGTIGRTCSAILDSVDNKSYVSEVLIADIGWDSSNRMEITSEHADFLKTRLGAEHIRLEKDGSLNFSVTIAYKLSELPLLMKAIDEPERKKSEGVVTGVRSLDIDLPCVSPGRWKTTVCHNTSFMWIRDGVVVELFGGPGPLIIKGPADVSMPHIEGYRLDTWNDKLTGVALQYSSDVPDNELLIVLCENQAAKRCGGGGRYGISAAGNEVIDPTHW